jgi:outer membrane lipoprotein carrier protein
MRWAYSEPEESIVVSDGAVVWIYDPAAREVQRFAAGAGFMSGVAVQFLVGEGQLLRDFRVKASGCEETDVVLELTPREAATYEKLVLVAHRATGEVRETRVHDLVGNVTRVAFEEMRTNLAPDPKVFVFEVPKGVRVVELTEPQPR